MRLFFIIIGGIATVLGTIGVFVPGLPTTPLILLASWCFYKGSPRLREKLLASFLGQYIKDYEKKRGLTVRKKAYIIVLMATMASLSSIFFIDSAIIRIIAISAAAVGCMVVAFAVPTIKKP